MEERRRVPSHALGLRSPERRPVGAGVEHRLRGLAWDVLERDLDEGGCALLPRLLPAKACRELIRLWERRELFRSSVEMAAHAFGEGSYRYFAEPLPPVVAELRRRLYPPLARIANRWAERLGTGVRYPPTHAAYRRHLRTGGQRRPTPLLLRYRAGGYNCLHQDRYGPLLFPLQVAVLLSAPGADFRGGELVLVENRPRMQARALALSPGRGDAVVFATAERPVEGRRGFYRASLRHGVSRVLAGERYALGIIFHDAA